MINFEIFNKKIGLSLSGGGIKSYAQQPVIEYLYAKKIKFSYFAGTSMGSVVATLLAQGLNAEDLKKSLIRLEKNFMDRKIITPKIASIARNNHNGFLDGDKLEALLEEEFALHGITHIEDLKSSLFVVAVDLITSQLVIFTSCKTFKSKTPNVKVITSGKLSQIVRASCSIPVLLPSVDIEDMKLVDGGILMAMPVTPILDAGAKKVVSISMLSDPTKSTYESIMEVGLRSLDMIIDASIYIEKEKSNLNINIPLGDIKLIDVGKSDSVFEISKQWLIDNSVELDKQLKEKEIL
jgi:NTE family protein